MMMEEVVTICAVVAIIVLLLILIFHHFPRWTWMRSYVFYSSNEEKMVLTQPGHYTSDGCIMIPSSDSEFNLSNRGSFRRFDKTDHDYSLLRQPSTVSLSRQQGNNIPPQPLRPAPILPSSSNGASGPIQSQSSQDSIFSTAPSSTSKFPLKSHQINNIIPFTQGNSAASTHSQMSRGDGNECSSLPNFSNNNPFLPLLQASTQFFTQKFQELSRSSNNTATNTTSTEVSSSSSNVQPSSEEGVNNGCESNDNKSQSSNESSMKVSSNACNQILVQPKSSENCNAEGRSMGEILFSSPPAHSLTDSSPDNVSKNQSEKIKSNFINQKQATGEEEHTSLQGTLLEGNGIGDELGVRNENETGDIENSLRSINCCEKEPLQSFSSLVDHFDLKKASPTNLCTKSGMEKIEHHNSPTRIRDRQRKMELTLQHLQNNQEDRMMSKKHYNPDSHYPTCGAYVSTKGECGADGKSCGMKSRFRPAYRSVPTLNEADEPPPSESPQPVQQSSTTVRNSSIDVRNIFQLPEIKGEGDLRSNKWILESMREEIRLENARMADATKSLMMEEDFSGEKYKSNGIGLGSSSTSSHNTKETQQFDKNEHLERMNITKRSMELELSTPDVGYKDSARISNNANYDRESNVSSNCPITVPNHNGKRRADSTSSSESFSHSIGASTCIIRQSSEDFKGHPSNNHTPSFRNTRSFSLRQSSTDSVGSEGSDTGSPEGSLPSLQRAMSCDSVSSDTSIVLGDLDPPHPTGHLCIGLEYDSETADLLVNVVEAKELVGPDPSSSSPFDSYVRVYLLPDKTTNMQTRVYRKSLNPVYREKFMFGLETMELPLRTLVFYLYATDKHSNTLVGETEVKLGDLDIYQPITTWLQLTDTGQRGGESGEIMFSLSYLPTAERLTVVVVKARNLKFLQERKTGDPFVKVYLLQKGKKVSKKKSSTKRGERNPIFNEAMIFSVPAHALNTIQLRITVADSCEIEGRANSVGHVIVGSSTSGKPLSHWNQMLSSLRKPIAMWHPLRK